MAPPKDIARSYPKRGLTADVGFRSEPKFCGDGSVELDGSTQGATSATSYSAASAGAKTTLACWVNPHDLSGSNRTMVGNCVNNTTDNMALYQSGTNEMDAIIYYGSGLNFKFAAKNLDENRWYFLAATFDYDATTFKFYVDGVEFSDTPSLGYGGTAGLFEIGFRDDSGGDIQHVNANLAHVMLIEDVLTQSEVVELMRDTTYAKAQTFGTVNRYYELDADFNDSTGSHNATSVGSPSFTVDRPQLPRGLDLARGAAMARVYTGRAVELDGSADYLQTTLDSALGETFTVSAWVYRTSPVSGFDVIWETGTFGANAALRPAIKNTAEGLIDLNDNAGVAVSTKGVGLDRWAHVVICAIAGAGNTKIYVDGVDATPASHSVFVNATNALFEIGRYIGGAHYLKGYISDVRVFNSTLTADQVKELYHYPEQVLPTGVSASNLIHRWALSDYNDTGGTGGRYFQDSAGSNAMEDKSSASMEFAQPVPCPQLGLQQSATRLRFPGGATTHNAVATTAALGTTASVSCWFQVENTGSTRVLWAIGNALGTGFLEAFVNSGDQLQIFGQNSFFVATITDSDWHHLVVTTDSGSPPYRVFLDNSEVSLSGTDTARNLTNGTFEIGNQDTASSPFVFQGILNDVACWNTELGASDVAALYNSGVQGMDVGTVQSANLKGWWKCDDLTTLKDYSGNGANATVTNTFAAASFPENASGSTIVGDFTLKRRGVSVLNKTEDDNDVLAIIPASADVFPTSQGFTLSVWLRGGQEASRNAYILATTNRTASQRYGIYTQSGSNNWGLEMPVSASPTTADAAITYDPNEWACLSFTLDFGTNTVKMYTNGALQTTVTRSLTVPTTFSDINVGGSGAAHPTITGTTPIALFKTAQRTWSDDEVKRNYYSDLRLIKGLDNE